MTEKEEWFKEQCKQEGLSTEEITVFGGDSLTDLDRYYATNRDGDFLYGIQLKEGSYEMGYVSAADLIEDGSFYAEWLYFLLVAMEPDPTKIRICTVHAGISISLLSVLAFMKPSAGIGSCRNRIVMSCGRNL